MFIFFISYVPTFKRQVCGKDDSDIGMLTSVGFKDKDSSDLKYHFYNIENPKSYLEGNDVDVVEKGPYKLK